VKAIEEKFSHSIRGTSDDPTNSGEVTTIVVYDCEAEEDDDEPNVDGPTARSTSPT
jgi:hypothetical protein